MSIFVEGQLSIPSGQIPVCLRWSRTQEPICAVALQGRTERGDLVYTLGFYTDAVKRCQIPYYFKPSGFIIVGCCWVE